MPPFGNTVGFINGDKGEVDPLQKFNVFFFGQGLRGHVQQLGNPLGDILLHHPNLVFGQGAVQDVSCTLAV